jgi:tetratricopeptide (TPR) repeat protein
MDRSTRNQRCGRRTPVLPVAIAAAMLALLAARDGKAQPGEEVPRPSYYAAVDALYSGDYRDAERALRREVQRAIKTAQARWIDSISSHAMLGEVLYYQGRNAEALAEFDQACQLVLAYPDWLLRVRFQQPVRPDPNRARHAPPWGRSDRQFMFGQLPPTELVLIGQVDQSQAVRQGGVVSMPQFWRVNIVEIVRTSALAIRRRNEILGPLAKYDPISKDLADLFSRGDLAPRSHWSGAWIELEYSLALAGMGRTDEARAHLARAVLLDGQYDHPLTCVALLEQGRLAMAGGDSRAAAQFFGEAGISAFYYDNTDVMSESLWLGWVNHMASSQGLYPPLPRAAASADSAGLRHISVRLQLAQAESLIGLGQVQQAAALLDQTARRMGDMRFGLPGIHQAYLEAQVHFQQGGVAAGNETLGKSLVAQAAASLRNFQIGRTNDLFDMRVILARTAAELYEKLLADPTPAEWTTWPLDAIAVLKTPHDAAFDRWLGAALERNDVPLAIEISERTKRHRFLASLPLGGRLAALRAILEAPPADLTREQLLEQQALLAGFPDYRELEAAGQKLADELRAGPIVAQDGDDSSPQRVARGDRAIADSFSAWDANAQQREQMLLAMALRRLPSSMVFPPLRTTEQLQQSLSEGEALAVFHAAGDRLLGFLVSSTDTHIWEVSDQRRLQTAVGTFLRDLGNYGPTRSLSFEDLQDKTWRESGEKLFGQLFGDSRLYLAKTKSLVIVPDGWLWYLPFEALVTPDARTQNLLSDRLLVRYGPTAALAVGDERPLRRTQHTGIAANDLAWFDSDASREKALRQLDKAVSGPVRLPSPMPEPGPLVAPLLDELVNLDDVDSSGGGAYDWSPLPPGTLPKAWSRSGATDTLFSWFALPYGGPERVVLAGFATAAENGLKGSRRGGHRPPPGSEMFLSVCGLMSSGARTILLSRWRTGGQTNFDLVREFVQELPNTSAVESWRRSVLLARESPLEPNREPRVKKSDESGEPPTADHPFFWAGYLLIDTGPQPAQDEEAEEALEAADKEAAEAATGADKSPPAKPAGQPGDAATKALPPPSQ